MKTITTIRVGRDTKDGRFVSVKEVDNQPFKFGTEPSFRQNQLKTPSAKPGGYYQPVTSEREPFRQNQLKVPKKR